MQKAGPKVGGGGGVEELSRKEAWVLVGNFENAKLASSIFKPEAPWHYTSITDHLSIDDRLSIS